MTEPKILKLPLFPDVKKQLLNPQAVSHPLLGLLHREDDSPLLLVVTLFTPMTDVFVLDMKFPVLLMNHVGVCLVLQ